MGNRRKNGQFGKGRSGNPGGRPRKALRLSANAKRRQDDWQNTLTGAGIKNIDARMSTTHVTEDLDPEQCDDLWRGDAVAARVVETRPNEMMREGWTIATKDDPHGVVEGVTTALRDLDFNEALHSALEFQRGLGGSAIVVGANDSSSDMREPLRPDKVTEINWFTVLEPREIFPTHYYADPYAPKYGKPALYQINPYAAGTAYKGVDLKPSTIHESRLIIFDGVRTSRRMRGANNGWGDSVLVRLNPALRDFNVSFASAATLLQEFAPAVWKISGLAELLSMDSDTTLEARIKAIILAKSTIGATVIDESEEYGRTVTPVSGMSDLLDKMLMKLSIAADMPATLLAGISPGGLNATGASDVRFFYDRVASDQPKILSKPITRVVRLMMQALRSTEPDHWEIEYNPLWQETDGEKAATRKLVAETDVLNINAAIVSPEEIAASRFGGARYSMETSIDFSMREQLDAPVPEPVGKEEPEPVGFPGAAPSVAKAPEVETPEPPE